MKIFSSETVALLANVFENLFFWNFWTFGDVKSGIRMEKN